MKFFMIFTCSLILTVAFADLVPVNDSAPKAKNPITGLTDSLVSFILFL